jgi:hypothetical protein
MASKPIPEAPEDVKWRVEKFKANYVSLGNEPFKHFLCPILLVDDDTELCRGHVIPSALGDSNI